MKEYKLINGELELIKDEKVEIPKISKGPKKDYTLITNAANALREYNPLMIKRSDLNRMSKEQLHNIISQMKSERLRQEKANDDYFKKYIQGGVLHGVTTDVIH